MRDETKCSYCGAERTWVHDYGQGRVCASFACGTSTYYDGPDNRGSACLEAVPEVERPEEPVIIKDPIKVHVGPRVQEVPKPVVLVLDAPAKSFRDQLNAWQKSQTADLEKLATEAKAITVEGHVDGPEAGREVADTMRRRLKVRRCDLTNEAKRVGGELRSLATETTEAGAKLVAIIGPEEDRLGIEVERQDNLRLEARLHEADEAGVRDRIDFKVAKDSADVTWRKHLADRVDAKRLADEEKRRADAAKELNAVRVARLRELVALGMAEDLQRLHELDAEAWASLEGKAVEAAEMRRQEDERRELNSRRLEVLRALGSIHLADDPTHLGDLSEDEWTERLTAARASRAEADERQRQLDAMELHRSRVRILSEAGAVKHIAPELLADLSQATAEEIEEATEKARTEQAEEEKKRRDAEEIAAQERDKRRINRLGALAEILPGWFEGQTDGVDIADISQDEYDKLVTDCIAEADKLDAIAEAERPDREKIVAWAKAAIAAIPALPAIASAALLRELQVCELDIRQRLDLLQVETKENA